MYAEEEFSHFLLIGAAVAHAKKCKRKRKHMWWARAIVRNRQTFGTYNHLVKELELADEEFKGYFRLNKQQFGYVLSLVEEFISKKSVTRQTIGAKQRLAICLR
jgi:hypothetical protein